MRNVVSKLFIVLIALLPLAAAADSIVFENPYIDGKRTADYSWCSGCKRSYRVWDSFDLVADTSIERIDARLLLSGTTAIEYSIWTIDRTSLLFSQVFSIEELKINAFLGYLQNDVTALLAGPHLAAGSYSLSIWDLGHHDSTLGWYNIVGLIDGSAYQSMDAGGQFMHGGATGRDMAFRLYGTQHDLGTSVDVPEPGTLALFGLGLVGLAFGRRRKTIA